MTIIHEPDNGKFYTIVNGFTAHVSYRVENGCLDIRHTIVPEEIGGRGIASELVRTAYDYAVSNAIWLDRHPEYKGSRSKDWCEDGSCAL